MRHRFLPFMAALLMALPLVAHSGPNVTTIDGYNYNPTTKTQTNTVGVDLVNETNPDRTFVLITPLLQSQFLHVTGTQPSGTVTVDSCNAVNTQGYQKLWIALYPTFDDSTWAWLGAIQFRAHSNSGIDSLSVYTPLPLFPAATGVGLDSLGSFYERARDDSVTALTGIFSSERPLILHHSNGPRGKFFPVTDGQGNWIQTPFFSIRWRDVGQFNASGIKYVSATQGQRFILRAELWGER